jgi:hypothetical protein
MSSAISFINIRNNKGCNTDPWGTPALSSPTLEIAWLVKFNPSKTDIMVFSANNQQNDLIFDFNSTLIQTVNTHKHLGVISSCDCKWTKHIYL